jgi:hypothetical protein
MDIYIYGDRYLLEFSHCDVVRHRTPHDSVS